MFLPLFLFSKTIKIVTLQYPPYEYEQNNLAKGINVEIIKEAFKRANIGIQIKFLPWSRALIMVKNGYADAILDIAYTKERTDFLHYTNSELNTINWTAFKKKGRDVSINENFSNSNELTVGITNSFQYGGIIQELIDNKRFKDIQVVSNYYLNIEKLIANRFDIFFGIKANTLYLINQMNYIEQVEIVKTSNSNEEYIFDSYNTFIAFSKKTTTKKLVTKISDILHEMKKDGTISKIKNLYLKKSN